jgi:GntR family transcriptional regulator
MLYARVKQKLIADIVSGAVPPGGNLANESELAKRFGVSIGTVRRAVDELVADHILVRQQGRGTFVGKLDNERFMYQFFKIVGRDGTREFPQVLLLSFVRARANQQEAKVLGLASGAAVFRIENVLTLKGQTVIHDTLVISASRFSGLTKADFAAREGTIYELYQTGFGVTIIGADERVRAELVDSASAAVLGLQQGAPVLRIERTAFTFAQEPAEYRVSVVNTQDFDYASKLVGQA